MGHLNINIIKKLCNEGKIQWANHVISRLLKRNILQKDIKKALLQGQVIESYDDDYPHPSCLVLGKTNNIFLHVVCGSDNEKLWIITAYIPDNSKWKKDLKTRKRGD